jgi:hypothetical protein
MIRSVRVFLVGLLLGSAVTLAVTQQKVTFGRTEDGFQVTCKTQFLQEYQELPGQLVERVRNAWQK